MTIYYTCQARLNFDPDQLLQMGISRAYVTPFSTNNKCLSDLDIILANLDKLAHKAEAAAKKGLKVYPFFVTINHPQGNVEVPGRYRRQSNLDGTERPGFICFRDAVRQDEMIQLATKAAELGFQRIAFDDDLRDAFCYCHEHLNGFEGFHGRTRDEISQILNGVFTRPEDEYLRREWYRYKNDGMRDYAVRLERAVHSINPSCRIGICNSAKRCQDFSGRSPWIWAQLFDTDQAPTFIRLCGECYDDDLLHLVQSTGWHAYYNHSYPDHLERMLELTYVPDIGYRSPGTVLFEAETLVAAMTAKTIHWAWTEDFGITGLADCIGPAKDVFAQIHMQAHCLPVSPLVQYIGHELGPYTPPNITVPYGATHDPISAYNIISLVGLPIIPVPSIASEQPAIMCSAYISRDMIEQIDQYVKGGGVAVLDVTAARCYQIYGGQAEFSLKGPVSRQRYEKAPDGRREDIIQDCPPDMIYLLESIPDAQCWTGYDINGNVTGITTAIIPHGKGRLSVLGYDLSSSGSILVRPRWRQRMLKMLDVAGVNFPVYWSGSCAVQCFYYGDKVALVNYNTNSVTGELVIADRSSKNINLKPRELIFVEL